MKILRLPAHMIRRLARKAVKPIALRLVELQMLASEARESDCITARGITVPMRPYEQRRQVELIARRNVIRGW